MLTAERVTAPLTYHGEGPFWDAANSRMFCVDMLAGEIVALGSSGEAERYDVPSSVVTVIRRRAAGGFAIASERGLLCSNEALTRFELIADVTVDTALRTNDGGCDALGAFVIGTMAYDERIGAGTVYRITPDGRVTELLTPVSISNGVQWSADGTRAYYIDTPTRRVDVFNVDPDTGAWWGRRIHIELSKASGYPDGLAIDEEDGLWIALWGGGAVAHYDAQGRLVQTIQVPDVSQTSACAFGGDDRTVLYITTSRQGLHCDQEPYAGAIYAVNTASRGAPVREFAG